MRGWIHAAAVSMALLVGGHGLAQSPPGGDAVATAAEAALAASVVPGASEVSLIVVEAATGRVRFARGPDRALNPASNTKIFTAAAALSLLGPAARFTTSVLGALPDPDGVVHGDLVLQGGGDPSLDTGGLYTLALELRARGIRRVDGDLLGDDGAYGDEHLPPAFEQQPNETSPFRAAVGALSLDDNAATLTVLPGLPGQPARLSMRPAGYFDLRGSVETSPGTAASSVRWQNQPRPDGRETARVSGTIAPGPDPVVVRRRLDSPALAAGWAFRAALVAAGVTVRGRVRRASAPQGAVVLASRRSEPLAVLLQRVGKDSNNFYAEMILLALGARVSPLPPSGSRFEAGAAQVRQWVADRGIDPEGLVIRNGSGLYDANRTTARQLAGALRAAWRDPRVHAEFIAQLAVGGDDGTLRARLQTPASPRVVRAKTGTLRDVVALSGYVLTDDPGQALVFVYLANGVTGRTREAQQQADALGMALVRASAR